MKRKLLSALLVAALAVSMTACSTGGSSAKDGSTLTVLNYGKYIDETVVKQFEKETGIKVKYEEYESPEEMYTKYKAGSISYDVICSSEYMVERLMEEGEVLAMDYDAMDNYRNLDPDILKMAEVYDKDHKYSVPYFYGTLGLLYNKNEISGQTASHWSCLWDPTYEDEIIMENSVRDTFAPALIDLGYSLNDTKEDHLREALELLKQQKADNIVYGYYVDETADAMINEEAMIALCYSGEAATAMGENENLAYSIPEEGSNLWIDSWFIPRSCTNQTNALKFLNFLCREDIAQRNFDYVEYSSPITSVMENQAEDMKENEAINPGKETVKRCEIFRALNNEEASLYTKLWQELLSQ